MNSCTPGKGFGTRGCIGQEQLAELEVLLAGAESGPRVLVLHHHLRRRGRLDPGMPPLDDASELLDIARRHDVRLILHGHQHTLYRDEDASLPMACAGSTTLGGERRRSRPGYRIFELEDDGGVPAIPEVIGLDS